MTFIVSMIICNSIVFTFVFTWFLVDTKEVRRLHKISKKENKKRKIAR